MKTVPNSLHIGIIRGGTSPEYDSSIKTGAHILESFSESHKPIDILISKDGTWHMNGVERKPERIFKHVDVVWNALHGRYGEDGQIQELLKHHGVKFTGSDRFSSAVTMNKVLAKDHLKNYGIKTPVHVVVRREDSLEEKAREVWNSIPHPLVVKPANSGGNIGFHKVDSFLELLNALENILEKYDTALVEEFISGREVTCLVTEDFRGHPVYAFPPSTVLTRKEKEEVEETAKKVHQILKLSNYSSSDFIVSPRRGVYFLEVNTSPKFHKGSYAHKVIESVGSSVKDFLHHVVKLAMNKK